MSHLPRYKPYYPKLYRRRIPISWWVHKWIHMQFILRELTSLFVAFYAIMLLLYVNAIAGGEAEYGAFLEWLESSLSIALHVVAFVMVLFHSITWFRLAPAAMVLRVRGWRIPPWCIMGANFMAWGIVSALLIWILLGI